MVDGSSNIGDVFMNKIFEAIGAIRSKKKSPDFISTTLQQCYKSGRKSHWSVTWQNSTEKFTNSRYQFLLHEDQEGIAVLERSGTES